MPNLSHLETMPGEVAVTFNFLQEAGLVAYSLKNMLRFIGESFLTKLAEVIGKYNAIIDVKETDPSLRIEFEAR
ncbi:hypothetical protein DP73_01365 [Desulfosporosinus sp. HMP52]|uniref:hypothetical protein n=1 Tax=Desulfosporosinus sp. HMP52 TaxID=1487923 RepID=UPI00051F8CAF|nr:hypothetical protein [Desulfosporosinus sp. HMP52]KGK91832.1 hypothetical protein DP73_01365 [Desulfosporosinus sp. HMP52]